MNLLELLPWLVLAALIAAFIRASSRRSRFLAGTLAAACLVWVLSDTLAPRPAQDTVLAEALPRQTPKEGFVSSAACRSCHPSQFESWHDSFHRTMTQIAAPDTVRAPFDNVHLRARGRNYRLSRRGEEFWVQLADPDLDEQLYDRGINVDESELPLVERQVVMTTGSHHFQVYWLPSQAGYGLTQLPFAYDLTEQRWLPREDAFLTPPGNRRHFAHWNTNCIQCHSTAGRPGHDPLQNALLSEVAEFGIACEACHGPGEQHVRRQQNLLAETQHDAGTTDNTIVNPANCDPKVASQICGQCHTHFYPRDIQDWLKDGFSRNYRAGGEIADSRHVIRYDPHHDDPAVKQWLEKIPGGRDSLFWPDGAIRVGGREYNGLIESACYTRGELSCLSCHSMHDSSPEDQLAVGMEGDQACLQCHQEVGRNVTAHTHHAAGSAGSRCYNCHMPYTSYALLKGIRAHRIDSPIVPGSGAEGRPNACNLCHLDQTLDWTAQQLSQWYGIEPPSLGTDERTIAASILWALRGDAAQRAITAWHYGWEPAQEASGREWLVPFLALQLQDPYSAVRFVAHRTLRRMPDFGDFSYDFLAADEQLADAVRRAMQQWQTNRETEPGRSQLLQDPQGALRDDVIQRLLREMDQQPIFIAE